MSDSLVCPIYDTTNEPNSTNCEVCDERIAPLAESKQLNPKKNISAILQNNAEDADYFVLEEKENKKKGNGYATGFTIESNEEIDIVSAQPNILYSPIDGAAYPTGSPKYDKGYGPLDEQ